jgi:hypothetical protein
MLSASPQLVFLQIDFNIHPAQQWVVFEVNAIHLPKLGKLSLTSKTRASDMAIISLLRQLCLPDDVCIELEIVGGFLGLGNAITLLIDAQLPYLQFHKCNIVTVRAEPISSFSTHHSFALHDSDHKN